MAGRKGRRSEDSIRVALTRSEKAKLERLTELASQLSHCRLNLCDLVRAVLGILVETHPYVLRHFRDAALLERPANNDPVLRALFSLRLKRLMRDADRDWVNDGAPFALDRETSPLPSLEPERG